MTRNVVAAEERTELKEIANLMQRHNIKRVPVVRDGKVVGIVSRANLLQGLLAREPRPPKARRKTRTCAPGCAVNWTGTPGVPASATSWSRTASSICGVTLPRSRPRMPSGLPSRMSPA